MNNSHPIKFLQAVLSGTNHLSQAEIKEILRPLFQIPIDRDDLQAYHDTICMALSSAKPGVALVTKELLAESMKEYQDKVNHSQSTLSQQQKTIEEKNQRLKQLKLAIHLSEIAMPEVANLLGENLQLEVKVQDKQKNVEALRGRARRQLEAIPNSLEKQP